MQVRFHPLQLTAVLIALVPAGAHAQAAPDVAVRFVTAAEGNEARYRVREQLAGVEFPSDAVGTTTTVEGSIALDSKGAIVPGESSFTVDLTSLETDSRMRDNFIRRRTLETEQYPAATLVPRELRGVTWPFSGETSFELLTDLTIRGVTRPVVWQVSARVVDGAVVGTATTSFTFEEFEMTKPRVARVLSVNDDIRLEYDFRLIPGSEP